MGVREDAPRISPGSRAAWRSWLAEHHATTRGVWVRLPRGASSRSFGVDDVVLEALCFGWIDGTVRVVDGATKELWMSPRRRGSTWSARNRARVADLTAVGLMEPAGLAAVAAAQADGSWTVLDPVDALEVPDDLAAALAAELGAADGFAAWSASRRRAALWSVISAKRPETRTRRIAAVVAEAAGGGGPAG